MLRPIRPEILSPQYKNGFGERQPDDRPWPRGEVIHAGQPPLTPGHIQYQPHYGTRFRSPGFQPGFRGRQRSNYQRIRGRGRGMRSMWHGSMPYGLQTCGMRYNTAYTNLDDGFIDDSLISDVSQFCLQGDQDWHDSDSPSPRTVAGSNLAQQTRILAKDCVSTPFLAQGSGPTRPKSVQTRVDQGCETAMSSSLSPVATSDASNPVDRLRGLGGQSETTESTSSSEPQEPLDVSDLELSNSSLSALRPAADFFTLAWDITT